jgi:hypothetical protein
MKYFEEHSIIQCDPEVIIERWKKIEKTHCR